MMNTGVSLSKKMPKGEQLNGLDHLAEVAAKGTDTQYVLLAVVPTTDERSRADGSRIINVQILGIEPLVAPEHRRAAEKIFGEARTARRGFTDDELPISD